MTAPPTPVGCDFGKLEQNGSRSSSSIQAACDELEAVFFGVAKQVSDAVARVSNSLSAADVRVKPPIDLTELTNRLDQRGANALTMRERKVLIANPERVNAMRLARLLDASPALAQCAARTCFMYWPHYIREPWGVEYESILQAYSTKTQLSLLSGSRIPTYELLARKVPGAETALAARLSSAGLVDAYEQLKMQFGVRDSWLLSSSVMNAWLVARLQRGASLDEPLQQILVHERLRALMLPQAKDVAGPSVRTNITAQAQTIATFLGAAFSGSSLLAHRTLATLTDFLLKSTFDDPRSPLRSQGWEEVNRLYEEGFRRLLASLCEQDLDVFFKHAMHEPDRHRFWLDYLPELERTGCVLDRALRKRLDAKLHKLPELRGAIERTYPFSAASDVQAFYLVFRTLVVVEFSHSGNAAYVYPRVFFEKEIEHLIRKGTMGGASGLKKWPREAVHRIVHHNSWQMDTAAWLAREGVHARGRRTR